MPATFNVQAKAVLLWPQSVLFQVSYKGSKPYMKDFKTEGKDTFLASEKSAFILINNLIHGTTYTVSVRASTLAGFGPASKSEISTPVVGKRQSEHIQSIQKTLSLA